MKNNFDNIEIRRQIILDHYENPSNRVTKKTPIKDYNNSTKDSPSCIDNITAYVKINNDKIIDVKFDGLGCAIATSSTDIMASLLKNKKVSDANKFIDNYLSMIDGLDTKKDILEELIVFENVNKQMNRIKCAKVGIEAIKLAINK
jgi:nitrogen fixation NifU-like protein